MRVSDKFISLGMGLVGLGLISIALGWMVRGEFFYPNWRGAGLVFAPFGLLLGVAFVFVALFGWGRLSAKLNASERNRKNW